MLKRSQPDIDHQGGDHGQALVCKSNHILFLILELLASRDFEAVVPRLPYHLAKGRIDSNIRFSIALALFKLGIL